MLINTSFGPARLVFSYRYGRKTVRRRNPRADQAVDVLVHFSTGITARLETKEHEPALIAEGVTICSPKDRFVKKAGRKIAVGRLIAALTDKADRAALGQAFFGR